MQIIFFFQQSLFNYSTSHASILQEFSIKNLLWARLKSYNICYVPYVIKYHVVMNIIKIKSILFCFDPSCLIKQILSIQSSDKMLMLFNSNIWDKIPGHALISNKNHHWSCFSSNYIKFPPPSIDLSHHLVSDYEQVLSLMHDGNLQRTTAATHMHELSSRSHAIFTITFIQVRYTWMKSIN